MVATTTASPPAASSSSARSAATSAAGISSSTTTSGAAAAAGARAMGMILPWAGRRHHGVAVVRYSNTTGWVGSAMWGLWLLEPLPRIFGAHGIAAAHGQQPHLRVALPVPAG